MSDLLRDAREKLAGQILQDFHGKITGESEFVVKDDNPENRFFVGKLLSNAEETNGYASEVYIGSLGADFYISENEFESARLEIMPRGEFYYRAYPTLDEQREIYLNEVNSRSEHKYTDFEEIVSAYINDKDNFDGISLKLRPVYKKVKIDNNNFVVDVDLHNLLDETGLYGLMEENDSENQLLKDHINNLQNKILYEDSSLYKYVIYEQTTVKDLMSDDTYKMFLETSQKKDVCIRQNWSVYIHVLIKKIKNKYLVTVSLVNDSQVHSENISHSSKKKSKDKYTIETLFNAGIDIKLEKAKFQPIILDYFFDDYKYDKQQFAIGANCSVIYNSDTNSISTTNTPVFIQKRLVTNDELAVKFQDLIDYPLDTLKNIKVKMDDEYESWQKYYLKKESNLTSKAKTQMLEEISEFAKEIKRFEYGIYILESYPDVLKSFINMNKAFKNTSKKYDTWRLFQIVFIVSLVPDIAACDSNMLLPEEKEKTNLGTVSLLYFPTGGGKTEAFLGVLVFNLFFDRYRGKSCGVTSILRYPLRLLSVQQVQRLANTLAQAELIRRNDARIRNSAEFSLGYFVGDRNTPNKINPKQAEKYLEMSQNEMDEQRIIDICPYCGEKTVHLKFDRNTYRLVHFCDNEQCESKGVLPLYIVDNEIYRYLPSAIISTVDKLAILGNNTNFRNILSGAKKYCPMHGYTSTNKCLVDNCNEKLNDISEISYVDDELYDPAPSLFIQDELHLIRESLGTYASHYESFIDYYIQNISPSKRKIKVIGASATISSYYEQIRQLYNKIPLRFPCASPYPDKNFYAFEDKYDIQRRILGYAPYGKAIVNAVVYSLKYMREVVHSFYICPEKVLKIKDIGISTTEEALKIIEDYWIFLEYNNVKRDGNNVEGALETPINVELKKENIKEFITRKMTGDESFQDVREVLTEVENSSDIYNGLNLIAATSMISHGVDADRFNIMFFFGMPGNMAEYIQAYSRTGRKHSSIVIDIMRPSRETDQSYLKNFKKFHEYKDIMVEAVPINRWAVKAIDNTLPGILCGFLLNKYDNDESLRMKTGSLFFMKGIKKAISYGYINKDTIKKELCESYGCENDDLGNQYKQCISKFVDYVFVEIVNRLWSDENIFAGFSLLGFTVMNSLRNTDEQLIIELNP